MWGGIEEEGGDGREGVELRRWERVGSSAEEGEVAEVGVAVEGEVVGREGAEIAVDQGEGVGDFGGGELAGTIATPARDLKRGALDCGERHQWQVRRKATSDWLDAPRPPKCCTSPVDERFPPTSTFGSKWQVVQSAAADFQSSSSSAFGMSIRSR